MSNNLFTGFCLKGLERIYIPSEHVFAASRRLSGEQLVLVRDHAQEYRFTMNALMGLHHFQTHGNSVFLDIESDYHRLAERIEERADTPLDIAATAWTGRCLGTEIPRNAVKIFHALLDKAPHMQRLGPKALAWLIAACMTGGDEYYQKGFALAHLAADRFVHSFSSLVKQGPAGRARNWAPFGAQSYMAFAFLLMARRTGDAWAKDMGLRIGRKLVQLQGRDGQWGWMYYVPKGRVVDYYPVFSVHQYGYAPFFLIEAIDQGYDEFREPLIKGFRWILGRNELGQSMVDPTHHIIWRQIVRRGSNSRLIKILRGMLAAYGGAKAGIKSADAVRIDRQCWGFEMALPLCVFSGRTDFQEICDDGAFS